MNGSYYHAAAFDFDGTLVPTMHEYARIAAEEMASLYGLALESGRQLYLETSGIPFFQQLDQIFGPDPRNENCSRRFEVRKADYLETVRLEDATREALRRLRSLGFSTAVTSNNYQDLVDRFLEREPGLFDLVLGFGSGLSKGPTQFSRVLDRFGVDRRHLLFVGDSLTDARKALAFGIDFVAVAGTLPPQSFAALFPSVPIVEGFQELFEFLNRPTPIHSEVRSA